VYTLQHDLPSKNDIYSFPNKDFEEALYTNRAHE